MIDHIGDDFSGIFSQTENGNGMVVKFWIICYDSMIDYQPIIAYWKCDRPDWR